MAGGGIALAAALAYAFWPQPLVVDIGQVTRGPMSVTIGEEARTRVRTPHVVAAPADGRLLRVDIEPGDKVEGGLTTVARIAPSASPILDERSRAEARAAVSVAEAALKGARAELASAEADRTLATEELERARRLRMTGATSQSALDQAQRTWNTANATYEAAVAAVAMREAELESARVRLVRVGDTLGAGDDDGVLSLTAPISGTVLRVERQDAGPVTTGTPIMEIGDIERDLEVVAELLSTDAVQVSAGDRVEITGWGGGGKSLDGSVARVEPGAFTKVSALGVEEQRVRVIVEFSDASEQRAGLGAGYRVEVEIVVWEEEDALIAPSSALFREGNGWAVFTAADGKANLTPVEVGRNNGTRVQILGGVGEGDAVLLYPGPELEDGASIEPRTGP